MGKIKNGWPDILARVLAIIALVLGGAGFVVSLSIQNDPETKSKTITFQVNEAKGDKADTKSVEVPATAVADTKVSLESDLRNEAPPEAVIGAPDQITANEQTTDRVRDDLEPLPNAGASAGYAGCVTRFVGNQSSRNGVRPIWQVLHYTVSPNRPGWSDVWAVVYRFDVFSSQASSSFVIDAEGHCAYIVPIEAKPWTQAAGNSLSISYEIINSGSESQFMATAGYKKLRSVMRQVSKRAKIPMRAGSVYPARSGIVQHKDGGLAWGGHVDITPFSSKQVIKVLTKNPCTARCRRRKEHTALHARLRPLACSKPNKHPNACAKLYRRNRELHKAGI